MTLPHFILAGEKAQRRGKQIITEAKWLRENSQKVLSMPFHQMKQIHLLKIPLDSGPPSVFINDEDTEKQNITLKF